MSIEWRQWNGEWSGYVDAKSMGSVWFSPFGMGEWQGFILLHAREHGPGDYDVRVSASRDSAKDVMAELERMHGEMIAMMKEGL